MIAKVVAPLLSLFYYLRIKKALAEIATTAPLKTLYRAEVTSNRRLQPTIRHRHQSLPAETEKFLDIGLTLCSKYGILISCGNEKEGSYMQASFFIICGKRGIRTLGTRKSTTVFETVPFGHSGIFPFL